MKKHGRYTLYRRLQYVKPRVISLVLFTLKHATLVSAILS
jgi:hypothetical protein